MSSRQKNKGFTLIEILVVVVIIAIAGTTIIFGIGALREDSDLRKDALRLTTLIELASEEALLQGREFGLRLTDTSYEFLIFDPDSQDWLQIIDDRAFRVRELPEDSVFELSLEDREVVLDDIDIVEELQPQIMILSSGEFTPFAISMLRPFSDEEYTIAGSADGRMELMDHEETLEE